MEEEDEEEGGSDSEIEGKRKRRDDDDDDLDADNLDEDDLDLIEENIGVKLDRKVRDKEIGMDGCVWGCGGACVGVGGWRMHVWGWEGCVCVCGGGVTEVVQGNRKCLKLMGNIVHDFIT